MWYRIEKTELANSRCFHGGLVARFVKLIAVIYNQLIALCLFTVRLVTVSAFLTAQISVSYAKTTPAPVEPKKGRLALVIGISDYDTIPALKNPSNDSKLIAGTLTNLGFDVVEKNDLSLKEFNAAIGDISLQAKDYESVLFYFAGHGFQLNGRNYLVPADAKLNDRKKIPDETLQLDSIIKDIQARNRNTLILLDACRNNPIPPSVEMPSGMEGLAQIETGNGTFVAFATQPGNITRDGVGENSPFSIALAEHMMTEGISISDMMIRVRNTVEERTIGTQTPWDQSSLRSQFYFNPTVESSDSLTEDDLALLEQLDPALREKFMKRFGLKVDPASSADEQEFVASVTPSLRIEAAESTKVAAPDMSSHKVKDEFASAPTSLTAAKQVAALSPETVKKSADEVSKPRRKPGLKIIAIPDDEIVQATAAKPDVKPEEVQTAFLTKQLPEPQIAEQKPKSIPPIVETINSENNLKNATQIGNDLKPTDTSENTSRADAGPEIINTPAEAAKVIEKPTGDTASSAKSNTNLPATQGQKPEIAATTDNKLPGSILPNDTIPIELLSKKGAPIEVAVALPATPPAQVRNIEAATAAPRLKDVTLPVGETASQLAKTPKLPTEPATGNNSLQPTAKSEAATAPILPAVPPTPMALELPDMAPSTVELASTKLPNSEDSVRALTPTTVATPPAAQSVALKAATGTNNEAKVAGDISTKPVEPSTATSSSDVAKQIGVGPTNNLLTPTTTAPQLLSPSIPASKVVAPKAEEQLLAMATPVPEKSMSVLDDIDPDAQSLEQAIPPDAIIPVPPQSEAEKRDLAIQAQKELTRLGCYRSETDGDWGSRSARALLRFYAEQKLEPDQLEPTQELLDRFAKIDSVICKVTVAPKPKATTKKTTPVAARPAPAKPKAEPKAVAKQPAKPAKTVAAKPKPPAVAKANPPPVKKIDGGALIGAFR